MSQLAEINALHQRLDVFLAKLKTRVQEVGADAQQEAATLAAAGTDHESQMNYQSFVSTISAQMEQVARKAERTFNQHFGPFEDEDDDENVEWVYNKCEEKVDFFVQWVEDYVEHLFNATAAVDAERNYNKAVQDYQEAAAKFTCSQCGAPVPVPEMYYTAQYLTCLGCGTQSNFVPSTDMQALPLYAEDLARARTAQLRKQVDAMYHKANIPVGDLAGHVLDVSIREFSELNKLLPAYGVQRLGLYREGAYSELFEKDLVDLEPAGTRTADLSYVNLLAMLNKTMVEMRSEGHPNAVVLTEEIIKLFARQGEPLAQAVLNGTFTLALFEQQAALAQARPDY